MLVASFNQLALSCCIQAAHDVRFHQQIEIRDRDIVQGRLFIHVKADQRASNTYEGEVRSPVDRSFLSSISTSNVSELLSIAEQIFAQVMACN